MKRFSGLVAIAVAVVPVMAAEPDKQTLLSAEQLWRKHYTYMPPRVSAASAKAHDMASDEAARAKPLEKLVCVGFETSPPPDAWMQPDFADAEWFSLRGRQFVSFDERQFIEFRILAA